MADISDVNINEIKDLYESLDSLGCKSTQSRPNGKLATDPSIARVMTRVLY